LHRQKPGAVSCSVPREVVEPLVVEVPGESVIVVSVDGRDI
jgi:hypothetical protein